MLVRVELEWSFREDKLISLQTSSMVVLVAEEDDGEKGAGDEEVEEDDFDFEGEVLLLLFLLDDGHMVHCKRKRERNSGMDGKGGGKEERRF